MVLICHCSVILNIYKQNFQLSEALQEPETEEWVEEVVLTPVDEWIEEIYEKEVIKEIVEDRKIPQVRAMYKFQGNDFDVDKGEVHACLLTLNPFFSLILIFCYHCTC